MIARRLSGLKGRMQTKKNPVNPAYLDNLRAIILHDLQSQAASQGLEGRKKTFKVCGAFHSLQNW